MNKQISFNDIILMWFPFFLSLFCFIRIFFCCCFAMEFFFTHFFPLLVFYSIEFIRSFQTLFMVSVIVIVVSVAVITTLALAHRLSTQYIINSVVGINFPYVHACPCVCVFVWAWFSFTNHLSCISYTIYSYYCVEHVFIRSYLSHYDFFLLFS